MGDGRVHIRAMDYDLTERLAEHRFSEFPLEVEQLRLKFKFDWPVFSDFVGVRRVQRGLDFEIEYRFILSQDWKRPYSFAEYSKEFRRKVSLAEDLKSTWGRSLNGFVVRVRVPSPESKISKVVMPYVNILRELNKATELSLSIQIRSDSIVMNFDFPNEVRVPCEQYLLYFVQFLQDLGIEATSELQHEVGQVLFAVTPANPREALDKLRTALEIYLRLPSSSFSNLSGGESEVAIQRLVANIHHLKGQLALSQAILQTKDTTIQNQQQYIQNHQRVMSGEVMIDSLRNVTPKSKDESKEKFFGGTVSITKYEGKGFEVDLPEMLRWLKRYVSGGDEQS
jgi:hypothetical protein